MIWTFRKNNFQIEISRLNPQIRYFHENVKKSDFWTQISFLQGFSISIYMGQNGLKTDQTWPKPHFVSFFTLICKLEKIFSKPKKCYFFIFGGPILVVFWPILVIPVSKVTPESRTFEDIEIFSAISFRCTY